MIDWLRVKNELLKKEKPASPLSLETAEACLKEAESLVAPKKISIEKKVLGVSRDFVEIDGHIKFPGGKLASYIKGAGSARIFLVTIGSRLEERASLLMKEHEELRGYFLDAIGSLAVESLAEKFEDDLREKLACEDLSVSMRFSPGYCDWPIEDQFKLDEILDFSKAGVRLTKSCMMAPRKTISAMCGIGPKKLFAKKLSQCNICTMGSCDYRRTT